MMSENTLPPLPGMKNPLNAKEIDAKKMEITIHVCDEAKNLKQDFTCHRDLLLSEMKYFQDYLSADTQKWEDVDISVHCDAKIFDWLIRYVKRDEENQTNGPVLNTINAVSILISSDFLKMEQLVNHCIDYCRDNLSAIIATPCNMNCISDKLVERIASKFDQHQLEEIKDKKDKFKSKLFSKKIQELFLPTHSNIYCPNNASTLYKCIICGKYLLPIIEEKIECSTTRTIVDSRGNLKYVHSRDPNWNVTEFLQALKAQVKSWRVVFWRLWSITNVLECRVCKTVFPLCDLRTCCYHPQAYVTKDESNLGENIYPCCNQPAILFESIKSSKGCQYCDHKVDFSVDTNLVRCDALNLCSPEVYNELLNVVDIVCLPKPLPETPSSYSLEPMTNTELLRVNKRTDNIIGREEKREKKRPPSQRSLTKKQSFASKYKRKHDPGEEDSDNDKQEIVRVVIHQKEPAYRNGNRTWNTQLPLRLNQDLQRESDLKRMNDLLRTLRVTKTSISSENSAEAALEGGGIFHALETKMKTHIMNTQGAIASSNTNSTVSRRIKNS